MYEPIQSKSTYQHIVEQIKRMILSGELVVGDRLPAERELAEMFNVSRPPVREALKALEALGLLECRHGGGNYIVNRLREHTSDNMSLVFIMEHCKLGDLTQLRYLVEYEALREIAQKNDPAVFEQFHAIADRICAAASIDEIVRCDVDFHGLVVTASTNPLLQYLQNSIHSVYLTSIKFLNTTYPAWNDLEEARTYQLDILRALDTRDICCINKALAYHYQDSYTMDQQYDEYLWSSRE